jgi:alkyl hydroperoxide reductase subunit AhpC/predicted Ser/Thr protein kinase
MDISGACVGNLAPDFTLQCTRVPGSTRDRAALADYRGQWLVLMFYPRDFSLVCPTELTAMSNRIDEFRRADCEVLAISTDSLATHERWINTPHSQGGLGGLQFPLAADEDGTVCKAYSVYVPRQHLALRGLFIIDPNGVLQYQVVHNLSVGRRTEEVLRVLSGLQTGGLCPENWTPEDTAMDLTQTLGPGRVIGQYRIEQFIGEGSFGSVFKAQDMTLGRTVALKALKLGTKAPPDAFLAEARAAAALNHPNVCTIFALDSSEGASVIAMEYVSGRPLSKILEGRGMEPTHVAPIIHQVASGMAAAHARGIVHGDLKPANIMVAADGLVKIMDFGLARRYRSTDSPDQTIDWKPGPSPGISGTPSYMSPEQAHGRPLTWASDVFSLGLVLYEMLTGSLAVPGDNLLDVLRRIDTLDPERYAGELPEPFAAVVRQALIPDPGKRILTMQAIADKFR